MAKNGVLQMGGWGHSPSFAVILGISTISNKKPPCFEILENKGGSCFGGFLILGPSPNQLRRAALEPKKIAPAAKKNAFLAFSEHLPAFFTLNFRACGAKFCFQLSFGSDTVREGGKNSNKEYRRDMI